MKIEFSTKTKERWAFFAVRKNGERREFGYRSDKSAAERRYRQLRRAWPMHNIVVVHQEIHTVSNEVDTAPWDDNQTPRCQRCGREYEDEKR